MNENKILLVDDEPSVLNSLERVFADEDYEIFKADSGEDALKVLAKEKIKLIISDERMPGMKGSQLLSMVALQHPQVVRITLTGHASIDAAMKALNEGEIFRFMLKPWNNFELLMAVRAGIEKYDIEMKNRMLLAKLRTQELQIQKAERLSPGITVLDQG
ncbi:MAG: response regulator [Desulfuromonas sp.]|nr:MAG: response regulator [Desulfuromonas sp.]